MGEHDAGSPGVRLTPGRGDDHRAARPGLRQRRRHGHGRAHLAATYNRAGHAIVDHRTYGIVSDGDMMEGVADEAASLAGHLGLGKLIYPLRRQPDHAGRPNRLVFTRGRPHDASRPRPGTSSASRTATTSRPSRRAAAGARRDGAAVADDGAHDDRLRQPQTRGDVGGARQAARARRGRGHQGASAGRARAVPDSGRGAERCSVAPSTAAQSSKRTGSVASTRMPRPIRAWRPSSTRARGELPRGLGLRPADVRRRAGKLATRAAGETVINAVARRFPELVGGSADLTPSNNTAIKGGGDFESLPTRPRTDRAPSASMWGPAGATSSTACASTRWARSPTGWTYHGGLRPSARRSWSSATTCGRRSGWRR